MFQYLIIHKLRTDVHPCDKGTKILLNACCKLNTICTIPLYSNCVTINQLDQGESTGKLLPYVTRGTCTNKILGKYYDPVGLFKSMLMLDFFN